MAAQIKWNATKEDAALINKICDRAVSLGDLQDSNRVNTMMDITACHLNGTPIRLADWLAADDFNFKHDLFGIDRHMNRKTGKLMNHFLPRFSA